MIRVIVITMFLAVSGMFAAGVETPGMKRTRADFEGFAEKLPYLSLESIIYDRENHRFKVSDLKQHEIHFQILKQVTNRKYPKTTLLDLLGHDNPKVRTLAAVALFDREDPTVLPLLVQLCMDVAATFDGHDDLSSAAGLYLTGIGPPAKNQTVGDVTRKMVAFYMERSGFYYGVEHKTQPGFVDYWKARKNRSHCAAWFAVQLARASQGMSPSQKDCIDRIHAVRRQIDELRAEDRAWVLLWLNGESGSDALVEKKELVEACQKLGPDKLLLMLQNKIPSDDPDLQPRTSNNGPYQRMSLFVLRHAGQLLRQSDGNALLACERWQRNYQRHGISDPTITPWWAVAAARLNPTHGSKILHAAMPRFQGEYDSDERATLCIAMWQLTGKTNTAFILDWFYEDMPERGAFPNCRGLFIEAMGKDPNGKEIISELIQDKRLANIDWQSLGRLVRIVNGWIDTPIVTDEEIEEAWHPLGQGHYDWSQAEAKQKYPNETKELEAHLSKWRKRLRTSIPQLLDGDIKSKKETVEQKDALDKNRRNF